MIPSFVTYWIYLFVDSNGVDFNYVLRPLNESNNQLLKKYAWANLVSGVVLRVPSVLSLYLHTRLYDSLENWA